MSTSQRKSFNWILVLAFLSSALLCGSASADTYTAFGYVNGAYPATPVSGVTVYVAFFQEYNPDGLPYQNYIPVIDDNTDQAYKVAVTDKTGRFEVSIRTDELVDFAAYISPSIFPSLRSIGGKGYFTGWLTTQLPTIVLKKDDIAFEDPSVGDKSMAETRGAWGSVKSLFR